MLPNGRRWVQHETNKRRIPQSLEAKYTNVSYDSHGFLWFAIPRPFVVNLHVDWCKSRAALTSGELQERGG
jgi:hypothetical protein